MIFMTVLCFSFLAVLDLIGERRLDSEINDIGEKLIYVMYGKWQIEFFSFHFSPDN